MSVKSEIALMLLPLIPCVINQLKVLQNLDFDFRVRRFSNLSAQQTQILFFRSLLASVLWVLQVSSFLCWCVYLRCSYA